MNKAVEERVVAMYFDNEDFEKNAKETIETLGQLHESMNLEDSAKGFNVFEKLGKALDTSKIKNSMYNMRTSFSKISSTFSTMGKTAMAPVNAAESVLNSLKGYMTKFIGFDLAGKIVNSVESAVRKLTIAPVTAGWSQYEAKMDSVKTIMSGTGESIDVVQNHLADLTSYANKTIYSLSDMTSNLGKFTNNGMKLSEATVVMKGLANATADAGQGAQQASMAMYNVAQAFGVGKMTSIDWKSLENANIATTRLKNTMLEMAAAAGNIRKEVGEDGIAHFFYTKNSKGQELKKKTEWLELTTANFREYLSKDWLDSETLKRAFMVYGGEGLDIDTLEAWGIHDKDLQQSLLQIGEDAMQAATQVRTFSKMMDAAKESVQSGWADTFELIFGDMEQGTNLWTRISEEMGTVLDGASEHRNAILKEWSAEKKDTSEQEKQLLENEEAIKKAQDRIGWLNQQKKIIQDRYDPDKQLVDDGHGGLRQLYSDEERKKFNQKEDEKQLGIYDKEIEELEKIIKLRDTDNKGIKATIDYKEKYNSKLLLDEQGRSGRDIFVDTIFESIALLKDLGSTVSDAFGDVFGRIDAEGLFNFTKQIEETVKNIRDWFGKTDDADSRISKIKKALTGLFSVLKAVWKIIKSVIDFIRRLAAPVIDVVVDAFGKIGEFLTGLGDLSIPDIFKKIGEGIADVWKKIKDWFTPQEILDKNGKSTGKTEIPAVKWIKGVWSSFKDIARKWADDNGLGGVLDTIMEWKNTIASWDGWETISGWFQTGREKLQEIAKWTIWTDIGNAFKTAFEWVVGIFTETEYEDGTKEIPLIHFIKQVFGDIEAFFSEGGAGYKIVNDVGTFLSGIWNTIAELFTPKAQYDDRGFELNEKKSPIQIYFENTFKSIGEFLEEVKGWPIWTSIGDFLSGIWETISGLFSPKTRYDDRGFELNDKRSPIQKFFEDAFNGVRSFLEGVKNWPIWTDIGDFLSGVWESISGLFSPKTRYDDRGFELNDKRSPIQKFFEDAFNGISSFLEGVKKWPIWTSIGDFLSGVWDTISGLFKPTEEYTDEFGKTGMESPIQQFFRNTFGGIRDFLEEVKGWPIWNTIGTFLSDVWDKIVGLFMPKTRYDDRGFELNDKRSPIQEFFENTFGGIRDFLAGVTTWDIWPQIGGFFSGIWETILGFFNGDSSEGEVEEVEKTANKVEDTAKSATGIVSTITGEIPDDAGEAETKVSIFKKILDAISEFLTSVGDFLKDNVLSPEVTKFFTDIFDFFKAVIGLTGDLLGAIGRWISGSGTAEQKEADNRLLTTSAIVLGIIEIWETIVKPLMAAKVTVATESITHKIMEFAIGLLAISVALAIVSSLDPDKMKNAAIALAGIGVVLAIIIGVLNSLSKSQTALAEAKADKVTGVERVINNLVNNLGKIGLLAVALEMLPDIIRTIGEVKKDLGENGEGLGDDILKVLLGVVALVGGIGIALGAIQLIAPKGVDIGVTAKTIGSIIVAIALLFGVVGLITAALANTLDVEGTIEDIENGSRILRAIWNAIFTMFGKKSESEKMQENADQLAIAAEAAESFDTETVNSVIRLLNLMMGIDKLDIDSSKIQNFSDCIRYLGDGVSALAQFADEVTNPLKNIDDPDSKISKKIDGFMRVISQFGEAFEPLSNVYENIFAHRQDDLRGSGIYKIFEVVNDLVTNGSELDQFAEDMKAMIEKLGSVTDSDDGIHFDGLSIATKLFEEIQNGLSDPNLGAFDATPVTDAIIAAIGLGETGIALAVHNMVQAAIDAQKKNPNATENGTNPELAENALDTATKLLEKGGLSDDDNGGVSLDYGINMTELEKQVGEATKLFEGLETKIPSVDTLFGNIANLKNENGETIDLFGELKTQLGSVTEQMEGLTFEVTITPVFNMDELTENNLQDLLDNHPFKVKANYVAPTFQFDSSTLKGDLGLDEIKSNLSSIYEAITTMDTNSSTAINGLGSHMDGIAREVGGMQMVLDTGVLVAQITPMIDVALNRRSLGADRTGVVSNIVPAYTR